MLKFHLHVHDIDHTENLGSMETVKTSLFEEFNVTIIEAYMKTSQNEINCKKKDKR